MRYIISCQKSRYEKKIHVRKVKLSQLRTSETLKENSPRWMFSKKVDMKTHPTDVGGFIVDWDSEIQPVCNQNLFFLLHRTHGEQRGNNPHDPRWRIIVPFDKYYKFTDPTDYKNAYFKMLNTLFIHASKSVDEYIQDGIIDKQLSSPNCWAIFRPINHELIENQGEYYVPEFTYRDHGSLKRDIILKKSEYRIYTDQDDCKRILQRMRAFFDIYKCHLNWRWISEKTLSTCRFGGELHDEKNGDIYFNNPVSEHVANIKCMHQKCLSALLEKMAPYQDLKSMVTNYTVLHLAYGIISGAYSLAQVEACAFHNHIRILEHFDNLRYMRFDPKIDSPVWLKLMHDSIVKHPLTSDIYEYKDGYYVKLLPDIIEDMYQDVPGSYMAYRTKSKRSKTYVQDIITYGRGTMLANFSKVIEGNGLNLKNGCINLLDDGNHEFIPSNPLYFYSHKLDYDYDENAMCPMWLKSLTDYFGDLESPKAMCLQEFAGYCLTTTRKFEKLLAVFGVARCGKNTVIQTIKALIPSISLHAKQICNFKERETIIGKKIVFIDEFNIDSREATLSEFKKISSTDAISIRRLHRPEVQLEDVPKLILSFNKPPKNFRIDQALGERLISIKFSKSFAKNPNVNLKDDLLKERSGILNWALEGYKRIMENNKFTEWREDTEDLRTAMDDDETEEDIEFQNFVEEQFSRQREWKPHDLHIMYQKEKDENCTFKEFAQKITFSTVNRRRTGNGICYYL